jgi:hypothetical protein
VPIAHPQTRSYDRLKESKRSRVNSSSASASMELIGTNSDGQTHSRPAPIRIERPLTGSGFILTVWIRWILPRSRFRKRFSVNYLNSTLIMQKHCLRSINLRDVQAAGHPAACFGSLRANAPAAGEVPHHSSAACPRQNTCPQRGGL